VRPQYFAVGDSPSESSTQALLRDEPFWHWRPRLNRVVATFGALVAVGGILLLSRAGARDALWSHLHAPMEKVEWNTVPPCGLMEHGVSYEVGPPEQVTFVGEYAGVDYDVLCRDKCFHVNECQIWTWSSDKSCRLMAVNQHTGPRKVPKAGATSGGMPCAMDKMLCPGTLYCWALMQPDSYEVGLFADQFNKRISIFNCEEYTIFSNKRVEVASGLVTEVVQTELGCEMGGEFGTALNLDIFIEVWNRIVQLGTFQSHEWTVKSDADAVFFADRLKGLLPHHSEEPKGVYLNNCKLGMHGPLEVFSRNAVSALSQSWQACKDHFQQLCGGDCKWGEDMFIDQCLQKVAGARRDNEWGLLAEDHCLANTQEQWSPQKCDGTTVAFHPFKDVPSYSQCYANAYALAAQAATQQNQEVPPPR